MGGKTVIALGLVAGLVAGGVIVAGVIALAPAVPPVSPLITPSPAASAAPLTSGAPTGEPFASPTPVPAGSTPPTATSSVPPAIETSSAPSQSEAFGIGEPAPRLVLPLVGGGQLDLADYRGKPVWVNFMATWCPSCVDELPSMAGFAARYEDTGLVTLAVDAREDEAAVSAFFEDLGVDLPVGLDSDGTASAEWGAIALPVHYWIDADGIVRDGALGGIGPDGMARGLQTILPGVTVTP